MTQLILDIEENSVVLPESLKGGYTISLDTLSESVQMVSGRTVREYRGKVWVVSYQNGFIPKLEMQKVIEACEKGMRQSILCSFLTQENEDLLTSRFIVTEYERPQFVISRKVVVNGDLKSVPVWAGFSLSLREVNPHD